MRAYLLTTGAIFALIVLAHVARVVDEGPGLAGDPFFVVMTVAAAALSVWAWLLLRRVGRA
jgi:hypothetical protein